MRLSVNNQGDPIPADQLNRILSDFTAPIRPGPPAALAWVWPSPGKSPGNTGETLGESDPKTGNTFLFSLPRAK